MDSWKNDLAILLACKSVAELLQMCYLAIRKVKIIPHFFQQEWMTFNMDAIAF